MLPKTFKHPPNIIPDSASPVPNLTVHTLTCEAAHHCSICTPQCTADTLRLCFQSHRRLVVQDSPVVPTARHTQRGWDQTSRPQPRTQSGKYNAWHGLVNKRTPPLSHYSPNSSGCLAVGWRQHPRQSLDTRAALTAQRAHTGRQACSQTAGLAAPAPEAASASAAAARARSQPRWRTRMATCPVPRRGRCPPRPAACEGPTRATRTVL